MQTFICLASVWNNGQKQTLKSEPPPLPQFREAGAGGVPSGEKWLWAHASYEEGLLLLMSAAELPTGEDPNPLNAKT